jgi:hypothetical protein
LRWKERVLVAAERKRGREMEELREELEKEAGWRERVLKRALVVSEKRRVREVAELREELEEAKRAGRERTDGILG